MAESKDSNSSFFRKVARFVANPATDWTELNGPRPPASEAELDRNELKAMVERKRRNDFVRKREFDMLRKVRREGLTAEQLAALGGSSRLDDSETRASEMTMARADGGVKAKIDQIEQQMVGESFQARAAVAPPVPVHSPGAYDPTAPATLTRAMPTLPSLHDVVGTDDPDILPALPPLPLGDSPPPPAHTAPVVTMAPGLPPLAPMHMASKADSTALSSGFAVEVSEVMHDPELDEPVIAFANADFQACEQRLVAITRPGGTRTQHAETWLVLFDLYRATGQQARFEALALDYVHQFGWSAPQWYSLPVLVAEAAAQDKPVRARMHGDVGWACPAVLDADAMGRWRAQTLHMPLPWVFDFSALKKVETEAASQMSALFRGWAAQPLQMRWICGQQLLDVLREAAPTGVRDADPAYWLARVEALRLANRPDQFDEAAIDYCVTYEVSPPSWESAKCEVKLAGLGLSTHGPTLSGVSEAPVSFMESGLYDDGHGGQGAHVELTGQLVGDIGSLLGQLNSQLGAATVVTVSCAKLIRVDFIAAGDLLNWVLAKRQEKRSVQFTETHRLVALFFGAMGINEHAKVQVRRV